MILRYAHHALAQGIVYCTKYNLNLTVKKQPRSFKNRSAHVRPVKPFWPDSDMKNCIITLKEKSKHPLFYLMLKILLQ